MHVSRCTIDTHVMYCWTDVLKDFDSRTVVMGLKYLCGNADGMNDLASLAWPEPSSRMGIIACSIGIYTASNSAPVQTRIWPRKTINDHANV